MTELLLGLILLFTVLAWYEHSDIVAALRRGTRARWEPVRQWARNHGKGRKRRA